MLKREQLEMRDLAACFRDIASTSDWGAEGTEISATTLAQVLQVPMAEAEDLVFLADIDRFEPTKLDDADVEAGVRERPAEAATPAAAGASKTAKLGVAIDGVRATPRPRTRRAAGAAFATPVSTRRSLHSQLEECA